MDLCVLEVEGAIAHATPTGKSISVSFSCTCGSYEQSCARVFCCSCRPPNFVLLLLLLLLLILWRADVPRRPVDTIHKSYLTHYQKMYGLSFELFE